jgi:hypothetical protein
LICFSEIPVRSDALLGDPRPLGRPPGGLVLELEVPPADQAVGLLLGKGILGNVLARFEEVLAADEITDEITAPQALGQQDMRDGNGQGTILAGLDGKPLLGLGGRGLELGIHRRERPPLDDAVEAPDRRGDHAVGADGIAAPHDEVLALVEVVVPVVPQPLGVVGAELLGLGADRAMGDVVRRADDLRHGIVDDVAHVGVTAAQQHVLVRLTVRAKLEDPVRDGVECLVPADRNELRVHAPSLFGIRALQRYLDPVRVVDHLQPEMAAGAADAVVLLRPGVAPNFDRAPILHKDLDRAPGRAPLTG